ncbi:MAG: hypothetical protein J1F06_04900 [Prevotellaceae bacterium]|nr:hypothetical protein [Prevotellaceae bacterium]
MKQIYRSTRAILTLLFLSFCALGGMNAQSVPFSFVETFSACDGKDDGSVQFSDKYADNSGWTVTSGYVANQAIRLGASSSQGAAQTPELNFYGDAVLTFKAKAWNASETSKKINLTITNGTLSETQITLTENYETYTVNITGVTAAPVKISFNAAVKSKNRFYLSEVKVEQTSAGDPDTPKTPNFAFAEDIPAVVQLKGGKAEVSVVASSTQSKGAVTYSLKDNPSGASITNEGLFTATAAGTYTIVAQLAADEENNYAASTIEHEISVLPESVAGVGFSFIETFDGCDGTTGEFSGSAGSKTFKPEMADNEGWVFSSVYAADKAVKLGTGSAKGSATTPTLAFTGDAVLTFTAAAWNNSSEKTTLNISISDGTLSQSSVTLEKAKYNTYTINITGVTQPVTITIEANVASNNRFFLDYVSVVQESAAGETLRDGLAAGKFGTICVNRTIEVSETEGATFYTVAGAHFNGSNPDYIVLEEAETLEAGCGYIFEATAEAITTTNAEAATATEGTNDGVIYGSLVDCKVPAGYYVVSDNVLRKSNGESTIKAGRAYIDVAAAKSMTDAEAAAPSYRRLGFDGTLTGIAAVGQATDEAAVYDLSGRLVRKAAKGVYVVNGKKVLVK